MSRSLPQLAASIALFTLAFAVLPINAEDTETRQEELQVVVYPVHDLPVYTLNDKGLEFNPKVLVTLIKSEVDRSSWMDQDRVITPHEKADSLVIRQTRSNHRKIANVFEKLREQRENKEDKKGEKPDVRSSKIDRVSEPHGLTLLPTDK